jgi:hypothetical protein
MDTLCAVTHKDAVISLSSPNASALSHTQGVYHSLPTINYPLLQNDHPSPLAHFSEEAGLNEALGGE